ncbi:MAG: lactate utilization protein C [Actinomycetota bacterium]|nr:lactate utilization protein C [Actinomycetota bacterium]
MTARDDILARVRSALHATEPTAATHTPTSPVPAPQVPESPPPGGESVTSDATSGRGEQVLLDLFVERIADYRAVVVRCSEADAAAAVRDGLAESATVLVPHGYPDHLLGLPPAARRVDDDGLGAHQLDAVDAVVTLATVGIAETGTIVLDHGPGQGRRALSLVPDRHVCVVRAEQVVGDVPAAVALLERLGAVTRPLTWISGPSATSDIELDRVEGVHGPRNLHVVVVG